MFKFLTRQKVCDDESDWDGSWYLDYGHWTTTTVTRKRICILNNYIVTILNREVMPTKNGCFKRNNFTAILTPERTPDNPNHSYNFCIVVTTFVFYRYFLTSEFACCLISDSYLLSIYCELEWTTTVSSGRIYTTEDDHKKVKTVRSCDLLIGRW